MEFHEMRALVHSLSGDENFVVFTPAQVGTFLNNAARTIAVQTEILTKTVTFTSLDADGGVVLPVDWIKPVWIRWAGTQLFEVNLDMIRVEGYLEEPAVGQPSGYVQLLSRQTSATVHNSRLEFWPQQTGSQSGLDIDCEYIAFPTVMTADSDICGLPDILHEPVCLMALKRCKQMENDFQAAEMIQAEINALLSQATTLYRGTAHSYASIRSSEERFTPYFSEW